MLVRRDVNIAIRRLELQQIERGQIAGGIVKEHIFRARIGRANRARRRASVPVVHGGVKVQARIGRSPSRITDLFPQVFGL